MSLEEYRKNQELHRFESAWRRLDLFQKTRLLFAALAFCLRAWLIKRVYWGFLSVIDNHIAHRRAEFIPAHWIGK